jgi:hypothetical protein
MNSHNIADRHFVEWTEGSGIDPELTQLNLQSLTGDRAYSALLYAFPNEARRNDGRLRDTWINKYRHLHHGGWWCSGINLKDFSESDWGCFKPNKPRLDNKNKPLKYEHPPKTPTEIFALKTPNHIWRQIAKRYGVEMPTDPTMSFWQWVLENPTIPVVITEGAKKAGALLTVGYVAIALPGIFNGYRSPKDEEGKRNGDRFLIPELSKLAKRGREFFICFDQDDKPKTIKNVRTAIANLGRLLERKKCRVRVVSWPEPQKGIDDLLVHHGQEAVEWAIDLARPLNAWKSKKYLTGVSLQLNQRFIELDFPENQITAIKSPKGTGKTEAIVKNIDRYLSQGKRILVLTHRIQLAEALASRFGIDHISEIRTSDTKGWLGFALCIDSLHASSQAQFNPTDWENAVVVIDEVEQVLWHLLNSSTCKKKRCKLMENFRELIQTVIESGGKIILADADLTNETVDFISQLSPTPVSPYIIENTWKPETDKWKVSVYQENSPDALVKDLIEAIANGEKPFIATSGQQAKAKYGTIALEKLLSGLFPDQKFLRIDSKTVADPNHPAYGCIPKLNEILPEYDGVIASPSIETGVSIDIKGHFTSVWGIATGVQTTHSVRQTLARIREPIPRFLWAAPHSRLKIGNGSIFQKQLLKGNNKVFEKSLQELALDQIHYPEMPSFLNLWASKAAQVNYGMAHYREVIVGDLAEEGHNIIWLGEREKEDLEEIRASVKVNRDEAYQESCEAIALAPNPDDKEYEELQEKRAKTSEERAKESKGALCRKYPGIEITPEIVKRDDKGWHKQIQTHYFLTQGREYLKDRDTRLFHKSLEEGGGIWSPDFNRQSLTSRIRMLELLKIEQFFAEGAKFSSRSLDEWATMAINNSEGIKNCLGVTVTDSMKPIQIAQVLLKIIGLKLFYCGQKGPRGQQERIYGRLVSLYEDDNREAVFAQWLERDQRMAEEEETAVHTPPNNIYIAMGVYQNQTPPLEERELAPSPQEESSLLPWHKNPEGLPPRCALLKGLFDPDTYAIGWSWHKVDELGHWLYCQWGDSWRWVVAQWEGGDKFLFSQDLGLSSA